LFKSRLQHTFLAQLACQLQAKGSMSAVQDQTSRGSREAKLSLQPKVFVWRTWHSCAAGHTNVRETSCYNLGNSAHVNSLCIMHTQTFNACRYRTSFVMLCRFMMCDQSK